MSFKLKEIAAKSASYIYVFPEEDNDDRLILHLYDKMYDLNYQIVSILFVAVFQQYLHTDLIHLN